MNSTNTDLPLSISTVRQKLKLIKENEVYNQLNYLDLTKIRTYKKLSFSGYRKLGATEVLTHNSSYHLTKYLELIIWSAELKPL
jgi:hypothetical protein